MAPRSESAALRSTRPPRSASQPSNYGDDLLGGVLTWELDLWGRVRNAVAAGKAQTQAASADVESVRLALHAELAGDYIALRDQDAQQRLLEQAATAYQRAVQMTTTRFQGGISSELDVAQAQTQLQTAQAALTDVVNERLLLEHAIAALSGQVASSFAVPPGNLDLRLPVVPVAVPSLLLERRPDVAAAERTMANGAVDYLQVVTAQISALQAERSALGLQGRELQASVRLVQALGGGYQADWPVTTALARPRPQ